MSADMVHFAGGPARMCTLTSGATVALLHGDTGYIWLFSRPDGDSKPPVETRVAVSYVAAAAMMSLLQDEYEHIAQALASSELVLADGTKATIQYRKARQSRTNKEKGGTR